MWEWHKRSLRVNTRLQRESAINTIQYAGNNMAESNTNQAPGSWLAFLLVSKECVGGGGLVCNFTCWGGGVSM